MDDDGGYFLPTRKRIYKKLPNLVIFTKFLVIFASLIHCGPYMEQQNIKNTREIGRAVAAFFKENGITQQAVADRLGFNSKQVVANQLSGKKFGHATAARYAAAFGFSEMFLITGKGELISNDMDEVARLRKEVEDLKRLNMTLAETNRNLTKRE